jgi:hypothetical protein
MLAGHETIAKTVSKFDSLRHAKASDKLRRVARFCVMGTREAARDPAQAKGRGYQGVRGGKGSRR